jgi:hypothetical protein
LMLVSDAMIRQVSYITPMRALLLLGRHSYKHEFPRKRSCFNVLFAREPQIPTAVSPKESLASIVVILGTY